MDRTTQSRNAIPHSASHPDVSPRVLEIPKKLQQDKINAKPIDDRRDNETELSEAPENPGDYMPREGVSSDFVDLIDEALEDEEEYLEPRKHRNDYCQLCIMGEYVIIRS